MLQAYGLSWPLSATGGCNAQAEALPMRASHSALGCAARGCLGCGLDFFGGGQDFEPVTQAINGAELVNLACPVKLPQL